MVSISPKILSILLVNPNSRFADRDGLVELRLGGREVPEVGFEGEENCVGLERSEESECECCDEVELGCVREVRRLGVLFSELEIPSRLEVG